MAGTTPSQGIPYAERPDAFQLTADLRGSFNKIDSVFAQTRGESTAALLSATSAESKSAQALARALAIEDPIYIGHGEPTGGQRLRVNLGADVPPDPTGEVSSEDITDATEVGRSVLTAPLSVDARNALAIYTGTRALLDAGTDTAERTWDAKELAEYVTSKAGAATWDGLSGKPTSFPSTISEVSGLEARLGALTYSTGWRRIAPATTAGYAFDGTGSIYFRRRSGGALDGKGDSVDVRFENVGVLAGTAANAYLTPTFWLPPGFRAWFNERSWYLVGNVNANTEYKIGIVQSHRVRLSPESPVPGTSAAALQGTITFPTDDPRPTSIPGAAYTF